MSINNQELIQLRKEGEEYLKKNQSIRSFFALEKVYQMTPNPDKELESLLLEASYKGIWGAYGGDQYELMEYLARLTIHLIEDQLKWNNDPQYQLKMAKAYNGIAIARYQLGKRSIDHNIKASELYDQLLKSSNDEKFLKDIVKSKVKNDFGLVINLGFDGNLDKAKEYAEKAIELTKQYNLHIEHGLALKVMGNLLFYFEQVEQSFNFLNQSVESFKKQKSKESKRRLGENYLLICENKFKLQNFEEGKQFLDLADPIFRSLQEYTYLFHALFGEYYEYKQQFQKAKESYLKSIYILDRSKWGFQYETNVDSFLEHKNKETIYLKGISALLKEGDIHKGFEFFENYRSKLFFASVLSGKHDHLGGISTALQKERQNIIKQLEKYYSTDKDLSNLLEIEKLEKELYYCDEKIAGMKSSYKAFVEVKSHNIQETQNKITNESLIIEYFYFEDQLYIFLINKELFKLLTYTISSQELEDLVNGYLNAIKTNFNNPNWSMIDDFYKKKVMDILVNPILPYLQNIKQIGIIPYKILHSFPLHILFLSVQNDILISYLPNFQSINLLEDKQLICNNPLLIGDPRNNLKGSLEEVQALKELFENGEMYVGDQAIKQTVLNRFNDHSMIHYSGHIRYNSQKPLYSFLEMSQPNEPGDDKKIIEMNENKDILLLKEIYLLNLDHVKFLSLSGCSSGIARQYRGEEMVGLVRGFFYAGVKSIFATLWDIEDQSSKDFLITFFQKTLENGGNKKQGFLEAYHLMMDKYKHSFFYGGFILYEGF